MEFKEIAVVGAGIIGMTTAYRLSQLGHNVVIIDPELNQHKNCDRYENASKASLGILMGNIFRRSTGRSWRLRQRSMSLWPELIQELYDVDKSIRIEKPLIQLASDKKELELMKKLCRERASLGLKLLDPARDQTIKGSWPRNEYGGLISKNDGRINPHKLLKCLRISLDKLKVKTISTKVISLSRSSQGKQAEWEIMLESREILTKDFVIICSALGSQSLLKKTGHEQQMEAVLGQAIHLTLNDDDQNNWEDWPAVITSNGINLIPLERNEILIGATLEPGIKPSRSALSQLKSLNGLAPKWIKNVSIKKQWYGIRARPLGQPAPLLKTIEPGLIINTAHYRNGILLAPACAEWVTNQIKT